MTPKLAEFNEGITAIVKGFVDTKGLGGFDALIKDTPRTILSSVHMLSQIASLAQRTDSAVPATGCETVELTKRIEVGKHVAVLAGRSKLFTEINDLPAAPTTKAIASLHEMGLKAFRQGAQALLSSGEADVASNVHSLSLASRRSLARTSSDGSQRSQPRLMPASSSSSRPPATHWPRMPRSRQSGFWRARRT